MCSTTRDMQVPGGSSRTEPEVRYGWILEEGFGAAKTPGPVGWVLGVQRGRRV